MAHSEPSKSFADFEMRAVEGNHLKRGQYVIVDSAPCRIDAPRFTKTGKHGSRKVRVEGLNLLNGKRHTVVCPSTTPFQVWKPQRVEYDVVDVDVKAKTLSCLGKELTLVNLDVAAAHEALLDKAQKQLTVATTKESVRLQLLRVLVLKSAKGALEMGAAYDVHELLDDVVTVTASTKA